MHFSKRIAFECTEILRIKNLPLVDLKLARKGLEKGVLGGFLGGSWGALGGLLGVLGSPSWPRELPRPRKDPPSPLKRPLRPLSRTPKTPQDSPKTPLKGILEGRPSPGLHEHLPENAREAPKAVPMYVQGRSVKTKTKISPVAVAGAPATSWLNM